LISEGFSVQRREGKENEDSLLNILSDDRQAGLFAVADGLGGEAGGAEASRTAVEMVNKYFSKMEDIRRRREAGDETATIESEAELMLRSIREANARIVLKREEMPEFHNMGTTCVAARVTRDAERNPIAIIAYAGDSRAYASYPDGRLETLTLDDHMSFLIVKKEHGEEAALRVQDVLDNALSREQMEMLMEEVNDGLDLPKGLPFTKEDIRFVMDHMPKQWFNYYYNHRSQVFGSVGHQPEVKVKTVRLPPGSQIILASDGLDGLMKKEVELIAGQKFDELPYEGVRKAVAFWEDNTAQALVFAAKWRQGERIAPNVHPRCRGADDTTVVVAHVL
jgi:serine/threonine protein phosphatase PrpC